jgi:hypothetical protein
MAPEPPILVEVSSVEGDVAVTPRDLVALEDALALAFTTDALRVETKRQRAARIPAAVSLHAEELNACADPGWPKARVLACVESLSFPAVTSRPARFRKITHVLRMARRRDRDGETLALSLSTVGRQGDEQVLKQKLPRNAPPEERRAAVVEMAGLLLSGLSPRPEAGTRPR